MVAMVVGENRRWGRDGRCGAKWNEGYVGRRIVEEGWGLPGEGR